jgi:glycosyltransferase involved in cell wall biosynthesis
MQHSFVGFDCLSLPANFSGAGYYIYYLAKELLQHIRDFPLAVLCKPNHADLFSPHLQSDDKIISVPLANRIHRLSFYELGLKKVLIKEKIELFHATHYICPPRNKKYKIVSTFHDMGFFLHPNYYPVSKRLFFAKRMSAFLKRSERITAISKFTREAIISFFPEHANKIHVIYPGANHLTNENIQLDSSVNFDRPFILAVNSLERRKNIPFIIKVFDHLKRNFGIAHKFLLVGHPANGFKQVLREINQLKFSADVQVQLSIPLKQLVQCYQNADFFINASSYEGFGFTPLEAINYQLPTFLFRNQVVKELLGDHPYAFTGWDVDDWAKYIYEEMQKDFANRITSEKIKPFTWNNTATKFIELYEQMISGSEIISGKKETVVAS